MKIAMVTTDYLPNIGGIAAHIFNLSLAMQELGEDVAVFHATESGRNFVNKEIIQGVLVYKVGINSTGRLYRNKILRKLIISRHMRRAINQIEDSSGRFDVIHQHDYQDTTFACRKLKSGRVWLWTNHSSRFLRDFSREAKMRYISKTYNKADAIITVSEELLEKTRSLWPHNQVVYIPNGVNTSRFNPEVPANRAAYQLSQEDFVVLCPRRMARKNGVIFLAKAIDGVVAAAPNVSWKFVFVGSDATVNTHADYIEEVKKVLASHIEQNRVLLLGNIPMEDMPGINAIADVIMMPSLMEAVSLSALEGMATKKAMLTTNVGGLPEIIHHEKTGLLVPPEDPDAIADALVRLAGDSDLMSRIAEGGYQLATQDYSWHSVAERTLKVYADMSRKSGN